MAKGKEKAKKGMDRTVEQYCSVCKKSFEMPVVQDDDDSVIWLKCPACKQFLPLMLDQEESDDSEAADRSDQPRSAEGLSLEDLRIEEAREYSEALEYKLGEVVYHRSWNDYGKVVAKETLSGNRKTIIVHFVNQGRIRLLEGVA